MIHLRLYILPTSPVLPFHFVHALTQAKAPCPVRGAAQPSPRTLAAHGGAHEPQPAQLWPQARQGGQGGAKRKAM